MTEEVAALVLRDNYLQGQALSLAEAGGVGALDRHMRLIRELEKSGRLDRGLEFMPDDETLINRAAHHRGLTRPELAVLLAYAKMAVDADLLAVISRRRCATGSARNSRATRSAAKSSPRSWPTSSSIAAASPLSPISESAPAAPPTKSRAPI